MQKLAQICIRRPVFATMLIMALVVLGFASYLKLGVDLYPKIEFPTVTITTTLRGASPEEVETQVTRRIEEAVNTTSGIDELRSISAEGVSQVIVTYVLEKNEDVAAQEVRDKVASVVRDLPRDVDPPVIEKISTDASPVISIAVSSKRDLRETTKTVDDRIKKNIESIDGVGQVRFIGERTRQVQVWLDGEKLYSYNLNIDQVRGAVAAQNVEVPGGRVDQGRRELSLRTLGRVEEPRLFNDVIVSTVNGSPVRIRDIGYVEDGVEEPRSLARLDGEPAVVLEVRKQSGTNTLDVIHAVKARVGQLQKSLPPDYRITYAGDQSTFIEESFKAVQEHLILGAFCAALVVLLFIRSWRSTLIAALAIPTSIISTYTLMNLMGFTLNQITMLALVLVVGIVIDDAIVVLENIFRNAEEKKLPPMQAAAEGTKEIGLAVMATTFSLVIIFLPVAMMSGIVGRFMSSFGWTAAFAILVSLLVSFTLTPMLSSRFLKLGNGGQNGKGSSTKDTVLFRMLAGPYRRMLQWSMVHRWAIAALSVLVMISTVPLFLVIGKDFLPNDDQSEFEITFRMPVGSSLDGSAAALKDLEAEVKQLPGVHNVLATIGADSRRQVDRGSILVELVPVTERKESQAQTMLMARNRLNRFRDLTIGVQPPAIIRGGGPNKDVQFFIQGPDFAKLEKYVSGVTRVLRDTPGVRDLDSSYEPGKPELRVRINRDKAADLNVNVASIATALRTLVGGDSQVSTYREGEDRYDVQVRVQKEFRDSKQSLERLFVPSASLGNVAVSNVVHLEEGSGPTQIDRVNRQRQIMISANLVEGQALSNILPILNQTVDGLNMGPEYHSGLLGRSKEFGRASLGYVIAILLSIVFMYMVLASQFESFVDPIVILISLPLSVPFGLLTLVIMRENFSIIYTSLGILMLFGIVKKNAILQIDHIKALRFKEGMPRPQAILKGCENRLRPILMTTAALVAGMLPMALGGGSGAASRRGVAIVVIGGQSLCLLLTLLVTPVAYSLFDDLGHLRVFARLGALLGGLKPRRALGTTALLLLVFFALPGVAAAQPKPRVGVGVIQRKLTLHEAIETALRNNLDIEIERTNRASAVEALRGARGYMDTTLRFSPSIESHNTPTGSVLQGADGKLADKLFGQNFYVRQRFPWNGASLGLDFENARQSTTNPFASLNPYMTSRLMLTFTQPLLRNRAIDPQRAELIVRKKQLDVSDIDFELRNIDVVTRVESAYWDLAGARQATEVLAENVAWAREQLARNQRMVASGSLAPVEISAAEAELERRLDTYYSGLAAVTEAENALKVLLTASRQDEVWNDEIIPVDMRNLEPPESADLREAAATALKQRPELRSLSVRQQAAAVQTHVSADQVKPLVNLVAGYGNTGLGGTVSTAPNPFTAIMTSQYNRLNELSALAGLPALDQMSFGSMPPSLVGGYGTALSNLFSGNFQTLQAGISLDLTFRNRTAQANLAQSVIGEKRLKLEQTRAEQAIEAQVRNALQALDTARQRIAAAEASVRAAKEKLDSETRLYQSGESTNFLVLTRQNEYADSRRREVQARLDSNKAIARLRQALGSTLNWYGIRLQ